MLYCCYILSNKEHNNFTCKHWKENAFWFDCTYYLIMMSKYKATKLWKRLVFHNKSEKFINLRSLALLYRLSLHMQITRANDWRRYKRSFCLQIIKKNDCLFGGFHPTRELFTHMETSSWPVKGCLFWSMFGTYDHFSVPHLRDIRLSWSSPRTCDTHTYFLAFGSGAVT